jgi:hypothetical protein
MEDISLRYQPGSQSFRVYLDYWFLYFSRHTASWNFGKREELGIHYLREKHSKLNSRWALYLNVGILWMPAHVLTKVDPRLAFTLPKPAIINFTRTLDEFDSASSPSSKCFELPQYYKTWSITWQKQAAFDPKQWSRSISPLCGEARASDTLGLLNHQYSGLSKTRRNSGRRSTHCYYNPLESSNVHYILNVSRVFPQQWYLG